MDYEFNILYYINIYKKWWKTIVALMATAMLCTAIFLLLIPATYVSTVTIISLDLRSEISSVSSVSKLLGISRSGGGTSSNDIVIAILESNRMSKDIQSFLGVNKKEKLSYTITTHKIIAGFAIDVKGKDPLLTEKVANFIIQNLDKINSELSITSAKHVVKVLDSASYGNEESRRIPTKALIAGIAVFLLMSLYIFFSDYIKRLKD